MDKEKVPQTYAGFAAVHVNETGHTPSEQDAFDADIRAGIARASAAPAVATPASESAAENSKLLALHAELNKITWMGADEGWDKAIEAVRERIMEMVK